MRRFGGMLMQQIVTGTVENGVLRTDEPIRFVPGTRVRLVVEPMQAPAETVRTAWAEFEQLCDEIPVDSGGVRLTRDELHDRR